MREKLSAANRKTNRLLRSNKDKVLGGVSTGLGNYFTLDPTVVRIIFLFLTLFSGLGIILYILLWAVIPSETDSKKNSYEGIRGSIQDIKKSAHTFAGKIYKKNEHGNYSLVALIIVVLGVVFLFENSELFAFDYGKLWPILLIILGLLLLRRR